MVSTPVTATTCGVTVSTLADDYANAESIVVALVSGCANGATPQMGRCPDERYELAVIELLKDSVPSRDHGGIYTGGDHMGCGLPLAIGSTYLLFIPGQGTFDHGASRLLDDGTPIGQNAVERLRLLRDFRDRKIDDLSEPWIFTDNGFSCSLTQNVAGRNLTFSYRYDGDANAVYTMAPEVDSEGNTRYRSKRLENAKLEFEKDAPNRLEYGRDIVFFQVDFGMQTQTAGDSASITVGNASWPLRTGRVKLKLPNFSYNVVLQGTAGDAASEILEAMRKAPSDIFVSARRTFPVGGEWSTEENLQVTIESRSTQIAHPAGKFKACVDGSRRSVRGQ